MMILKENGVESGKKAARNEILFNFTIDIVEQPYYNGPQSVQVCTEP